MVNIWWNVFEINIQRAKNVLNSIIVWRKLNLNNMEMDWICLPVWEAISKLAVQTHTHTHKHATRHCNIHSKACDKSVWSPKSSKMKHVYSLRQEPTIQLHYLGFIQFICFLCTRVHNTRHSKVNFRLQTHTQRERYIQNNLLPHCL